MNEAYEIVVDDGPLDFGLCVATGQVFRWSEVAPGRFVGVDGADAYVVETEEGRHPLAGARGTGMNRDPLRDAHSGEAKWTAWRPTTLRVRSNRPAKTFRRFLRLDQDERETQAAILAREPRMASYLASTAGLRLLRPAGRFETILSFVCSANNHVPRIAKMVRALGERGEPIGGSDGIVLRAFPTPSVLAALEEDALRAEGFGYRAKSVIETSRRIEERGGAAYLDAIAAEPFEGVVAEAMSWRGVGPKVAECIALFAYDRTEAVPMDTHLWQMLVRLGDAEGAFTTARARAATERFRMRLGTYAARAQQALFYDNLLNWRSRR